MVISKTRGGLLFRWLWGIWHVLLTCTQQTHTPLVLIAWLHKWMETHRWAAPDSLARGENETNCLTPTFSVVKVGFKRVTTHQQSQLTRLSLQHIISLLSYFMALLASSSPVFAIVESNWCKAVNVYKINVFFPRLHSSSPSRHGQQTTILRVSFLSFREAQ